MKYPGESWMHQLARESLNKRERQAEAQTTPARNRPATPPRRPADATKASSAPDHPSAPSRRPWAWHGGAHPNDYRMTPEESDQ